MIRQLPVCILIYLFSFHFLVLQSDAAEYDFAAFLDLRGTYDDNVFFLGIDDFEYRITPSLAGAVVTDQAEVQAGASLDIRKYQDFDELDTVDQYYQILADVSPSERFHLDVAGTYLVDQTVAASLIETGILTDPNDRRSAKFRPVATFGLTPGDKLVLSYNLDNTQFEDPDVRDYFRHTIGLGWNRDLNNERTKVSLRLAANRTDYSGDEDNPDEELTQRTLAGDVGFIHQQTETLSFTLRLGARYTKAEFQDSDRNDEESGSFIGEARLNYRFERGAISLLFQQDFVPSVLGENVTATRADLRSIYAFTEKLRGSILGNYTYSESDNEDSKTRNQAFWLRSEMIYRLPWNMNLILGYSYAWTKDRVANETDSQNRIFLELRWTIHKPVWKGRQPKPPVKWLYR